MTLKQTKIGDDKILYSDSETNDPVATARIIPDRWNRRDKVYHLAWHPNMKTLYPTGTSSLTLRNFSPSKSASESIGTAVSHYDQLVNGPENPDPLKVTDTGEMVEKSIEGHADPHKFSHFHIHDPKTDQPVASLFINKSSMAEPLDADGRFTHHKHAHVVYHGDEPSEEQANVLARKHPGGSPLSLVNRVKTWLETRTKTPKFVGSHSSSGFKSYKTSLPVEKAGQEYVDHIKTQYSFKNHSFKEVGPGMFMGSADGYDGTNHELIDARTPGVITHHSFNSKPADHYSSKKLNDVVY